MNLLIDLKIGCRIDTKNTVTIHGHYLFAPFALDIYPPPSLRLLQDNTSLIAPDRLDPSSVVHRDSTPGKPYTSSSSTTSRITPGLISVFTRSFNHKLYISAASLLLKIDGGNPTRRPTLSGPLAILHFTIWRSDKHSKFGVDAGRFVQAL